MKQKKKFVQRHVFTLLNVKKKLTGPGRSGTTEARNKIKRRRLWRRVYQCPETHDIKAKTTRRCCVSNKHRT